MQKLLKVYFPYKKDPECFLPIEVDIFGIDTFEDGARRLVNNFDKFVEQILEENKDLDIETDVKKCRFEKITIEEYKIENV